MRRRSALGIVAGLAASVWSAEAFSQTPSDAIKTSLAPTGRLRVAINYGNAVLAHRSSTGVLSGVSVDIAKELSRRLDLPLKLVPFNAAGKVTAAASHNIWDVAFLALDPRRAQVISFTAAYVVINGSYVVPQESPVSRLEQVDRPGVRIAVSTGSAYDLFLRRNLKHAKLVEASSPGAALALFQSKQADVLAGVKQALDKVIDSQAGLRMIPQPFMAIDQAMGTPAGRDAGSAYLKSFVAEIKANGFLGAALARNGQRDVTVAPAG